MKNSLDKKSLRAKCLEQRQNLDAAYIDSARKEFSKLLLHEIPNIGVIAGYLAIRGEIDVRPVLLKLIENGRELCLPVIEQKNAPISQLGAGIDAR
jgi:5-formyltetrahydrofolate cyclo-ligase